MAIFIPGSGYTSDPGFIPGSGYVKSSTANSAIDLFIPGISYSSGYGYIPGGGYANIFIESVQLSYLRPTADISTGSWTPSTGTTLYETLDEVSADDVDYIQAATATGCEIKLSAGSTPTSRDNHTIKYRLLAGSGNIAVVLKCGSTTIKSWNHVLTGSAQDFSQALSNAEATNITDYSDLRVTFTSS